jgi:ABC-type nitrate/sulfonate/bicarbonate transport system substrate-binding protein
MNMRYFLGIVLITLSVFPASFLSAARAEKSIQTIIVGYVPLITQLPLVVSYDNDRINYSRVKVRLVKYKSYTSLEAALRVGAIDIADLPLPVALSIAGDGIDIRILGQCHSGGSVFESAGLSQFSDLKGKIIGVPSLSSIEHLELIQRLAEEKLRYGLDYKTIQVPFNTVLHYLETERINAMFFPEPYGSMAENHHLVTEMDKAEFGNFGGLTTVVVAKTALLQDLYQEAMAEWVSSLVQACTFIENDIENLSAEQVTMIQDPYFKFERNAFRPSLVKRKGKIQFSVKVPNKKVLKEYMQQAFDLKLLVQPVDIDGLVAFDLFSRKHGEPSSR